MPSETMERLNMSLVDQKPAGLPSSNELDKIPDDLLGPIPAEIKLGTNVLMVMEKPPEVRDVITVVMRLRVKDAGVGEAGENNEELTHYRKCKIVAAWIKGEPEPPNADEEQPALFGEHGEVGHEPSGMDEFAPNEATEDVDINEGVDRPAFSGAGE